MRLHDSGIALERLFAVFGGHLAATDFVRPAVTPETRRLVTGERTFGKSARVVSGHWSGSPPLPRDDLMSPLTRNEKIECLGHLDERRSEDYFGFRVRQTNRRLAPIRAVVFAGRPQSGYVSVGIT